MAQQEPQEALVITMVLALVVVLLAEQLLVTVTLHGLQQVHVTEEFHNGLSDYSRNAGNWAN
jgi:hypothetical protein